ncbi:hypothetical protein GBA52_004749 [Prunus armeniaca]|nr:hypothetical protein GBA52_004749 [Prunus armeniaca]
MAIADRRRGLRGRWSPLSQKNNLNDYTTVELRALFCNTTSLLLIATDWQLPNLLFNNENGTFAIQFNLRIPQCLPSSPSLVLIYDVPCLGWLVIKRKQAKKHATWSTYIG